MKTLKIGKLLAAATCSLLIVGTAQVADAGRGGSYSKVVNAINGNGPATIIAELERAERLVCPSCVEPIMTLLDDDRYAVREVAAWWFARRPAQKKQINDRSVLRLASGDSVQARNAADILGTFRHPQAIAPLTSAFSRSDLNDEARAHIVFALGTIGHQSANPVLLAAMSDASADVRLQAVESWIKIRRQVGAAPLAALVADSDLLVRRAAIGVIGRFKAEEARADLENLVLNDDDAIVRRNAAWSLGRIGNVASRDALNQAASDESGLVRLTAAAAGRLLR